MSRPDRVTALRSRSAPLVGFAVCPVRVTRTFPWRRSRLVKQPARLTDECFCCGVWRRRATRHCGRVSLSAEQFAACFCRPLFSFRWQAQLLPSTMAGVQHGALKAIRKSDGSCLSFPLFVRATFARRLFFSLSAGPRRVLFFSLFGGRDRERNVSGGGLRASPILRVALGRPRREGEPGADVFCSMLSVAKSVSDQ